MRDVHGHGGPGRAQLPREVVSIFQFVSLFMRLSLTLDSRSYTHYGGVCVNAEYSHEVGLRLVLHSIATTAARYGRHIEPLLSLSIDFYCRLFIRIDTSPKEVKAMPTKTSLLYYCHDCQTPHTQAFGRVSERVSQKNGHVNLNYHAPTGPPSGVGERCGQCGGKYAVSRIARA